MAASLNCPNCKVTGVIRLNMSETALVDYYRCVSCAHVWNVPKGHDGPLHDVTPKRPPDDPKG